jgi:pimeloyl-ACP methyl ester carboxylesterase/DNA-binding CsgD family transcriptional regulator
VILFDKRGTGLSDRVRLMPTTEERMDDLRAVMDASGCERAAVVGVSEGAPLAISFAAAYPERVTALILYAPLPKATRTDDYPWAQPAEWWEDTATHFEQSWGSPEYMHADVAWRAPSESGNEAFVHWWGIYRRLGASPGAAADLTRMNARIDVRDLLPQIRVPTLVLARDRDRVISADHARYVADRIPGATYLELPGEDHLPFVGDATSLLTAMARMLGVDGDLSIDVPAVHPLLGEFSDRGAAAVLSARERDVLQWVTRGKTNAEIATALYISESTVRKHLQNSYKKLGVSSRTAAIALLSTRNT